MRCLGAALALLARRAPVGRCELKAGGRAAARPPEVPPAAATAAHSQPSVPWAAGRPPMGRRAPPRLARAARYTMCDLSGFVCVERGFYTVTAYELLQTGPLYHMDTVLRSWASVRQRVPVLVLVDVVVAASVGSMVMVHHHGALRDRSSAYSASGQHG